MANRSGTAYQRNLDELFADSDSDFEGFVDGVDFDAGHQAYADSQLDDDKWKDGDRDDDPITFASIVLPDCACLFPTMLTF